MKYDITDSCEICVRSYRLNEKPPRKVADFLFCHRCSEGLSDHALLMKAVCRRTSSLEAYKQYAAECADEIKVLLRAARAIDRAAVPRSVIPFSDYKQPQPSSDSDHDSAS